MAGSEPLSQTDVPGRPGVDRTTTVALLDGLERRGLVERRRGPRDRRRDIVELTDAGRRRRGRAEEARPATERRFLAPAARDGFSRRWTTRRAATLIRALRALLPGR
ncbi:MarR family transcriptional regulator [Streptomyces sp. NPDC086519]|uniref:MarR family transcriptional regulator n=1 Tax=Streptomyces sp. NPDC086519 TaxID=3154863 RepID=UPI00343297D2